MAFVDCPAVLVGHFFGCDTGRQSLHKCDFAKAVDGARATGLSRGARAFGTDGCVWHARHAFISGAVAFFYRGICGHFSDYLLVYAHLVLCGCAAAAHFEWQFCV